MHNFWRSAKLKRSEAAPIRPAAACTHEKSAVFRPAVERRRLRAGRAWNSARMFSAGTLFRPEADLAHGAQNCSAESQAAANVYEALKNRPEG